MICSQDQTCKDVLYGASDAALEPGGSKMLSFVCARRLTNWGWRTTCMNGFKIQFLTYLIQSVGQCLGDAYWNIILDDETCQVRRIPEKGHIQISMRIILAGLDSP